MNLVNVEVQVHRNNIDRVSHSRCDAVQLLNTLESIVNRADIKICDRGSKVQYILEIKVPE